MHQEIGSNNKSFSNLLSAKISQSTSGFQDHAYNLQGDIKILQVEALSINYWKGIPLGILLSLTVFGLYLLYISKKLRMRIFYTSIFSINFKTNQTQQINNDGIPLSNIYIKTEDDDSIQDVFSIQNNLIFDFKGLRYTIYNRTISPLRLDLQEYKNKNYKLIQQLGLVKNQQFKENIIFHDKKYKLQAIRQLGLTFDQAKQNLQLYGNNKHETSAPNPFKYFLDTITQPLYLLQILLIVQNTFYFNKMLIGLNLLFLMLAVSTIYFVLYQANKKIQKLTLKKYKVKVFRDGKQNQNIYNNQIVPGDIYQIQKTVMVQDQQSLFIIPCDSILIMGKISINEVGLTGQDYPISKYPYTLDANHTNIFNNKHWLYEDTVVAVIEEGQAFALAVHTGYSSVKGRIIRKLKSNAFKQPEIIKKLLYFYFQVLIFGIILYLISLTRIINPYFQNILVFIRFLDFVTYSIPCVIPLFFTLAYTASTFRLTTFKVQKQKDNIFVTESFKIFLCSQLKHLYLDKTGTLTQKSLQVNSIFAINQKHIDPQKLLVDGQLKKIKYLKTKQFHQQKLLTFIMASCHSLYEERDNNNNATIYGNQMDKAPYKLVQAMHRGQLEKQGKFKSQKVISTKNNYFIQILKIYQFQSKYKSMSILVQITSVDNHQKDKYNLKYAIFVKGAIELIYNASINTNSHMLKLIQTIEHKGNRSLAFGYKFINQNQVQQYLNIQREKFIQKINFLGIITFSNKLKPEAKDIIRNISNAKIQCRIITGDNALVGLKVAYDLQMISNQKRIFSFKGQNLGNQSRYIYEQLKYNSKLNQFQQIQKSQELNIFQNFSNPKFQNAVFAIDGQFIDGNINQFFHKNTIVYGRITPETKGLIVKTHIKKLQQQYKAQQSSCWKLLTNQNRPIVGMVGDGINDQLAIKQADIGVALLTSDTTSVATFVIHRLQQILIILKESKSLSRQLIEVAQYFSLGFSLQMVPTMLNSMYDYTYFYTFGQDSFVNYWIMAIICIFLTFCQTKQKLSDRIPMTNMMSLEYHLIYWGNYFIFGSTMIIGYFYFVHSDDYIPNPHPQATYTGEWEGDSTSSTACFLMQIFYVLTLPIFLYRSSPWKQKIFQNIWLLVIISINFILILLIYSFLPDLFDLQPVSYKSRMIIFFIMLFGSFVAGFFNLLMQNYFQNRISRQVHQQ